MTAVPDQRRWKAIIFDLDGVLFRSGRAHDAAFRTVLKAIGLRRFDYRTVAGMKTEEAFEFLLSRESKPYTPADVARWSRRKRAIAFRSLQKSPPLYPGIRRLLKRLRSRFRLALVSSSSSKNVALFKKASRTAAFFSVTLSGEDVRRAKPAPDIYKKALRRLRLSAREAVVIEDAVMGVRSARKAGLPVIGLACQDSPETLRKAGAFRVIRRLEKLERMADGDF